MQYWVVGCGLSSKVVDDEETAKLYDVWSGPFQSPERATAQCIAEHMRNDGPMWPSRYGKLSK